MLKIENVAHMNGEQWLMVVRGARNPMNSWDKMDSTIKDDGVIRIGHNDFDLLMRLRRAGTEHCKYLRKVVVWIDMTAPFYFWKQFDTYKIGTVCDSCSTMHKLTYKPFELKDFSWERLSDDGIDTLEHVIVDLNDCRELYLRAVEDECERDKKDLFDEMIQLLPTSYNQKRSIMLNYKVLADMYQQRKNHKLGEWHTFCNWIESLPYSELITGETK